MIRILARATVVAVAISLMPAAGGQVQVLALPVTASDEVEIPLGERGGVSAQALESDRHGRVTTEVIEAPIPFTMVGFELPDGLDELRVRTSSDGETFSDWTTTERFEAEDRPDTGSAEATGDRSQAHAQPVWVEEATHLQVELPAEHAAAGASLNAKLIDSAGLSGGKVERRIIAEPASAEASNRPAIISRSEWGADESLARPTSTTSDVRRGVVHHTATSNHYSDPRAVMRAMYEYHTKSLNWADLGYNIVVDQQGNVYEGRDGGLENGVIGAHARGYNTGSFGVSVIGNFDQIRPPQAALDAVADVIAWQSRVYDIDPQGSTRMSDGSSLPTVIGHRDVGSTSCPGTYFHPLLDDLRAEAASRMSAPGTSPDEASEPESAEVPKVITPPETTIHTGPEGTIATDEVTIAYSATGDYSYFECQRDDGAWYDCGSKQTFTGLPDGEHTFRVRAVQPSSHGTAREDRVREQEPAEITWRVKTTAPTTTLASGPTGVQESDVATFSFSASEDDASFECRLNGGTWSPCASPHEVRSLGDGDQLFQVRAVDAYGNVEPLPVTHSWNVQRVPEFSDIQGRVHEASIKALALAGITGGYPDGTFRPEGEVTRGQMATFLTKGLGLADGTTAGFFDSVGSLHEHGINAVATAGITQGYEDGTFRPGQPVTREQLATFLARALELEPLDEVSFSDTAGSAHRGNIEAVAKAGITGGYGDGTFGPGDVVTREQMATLLYGALDL